MGLRDALFGRTRPVAPQLDQLFALPTAALTLQTELDLVSSGHGGVCFKSASGENATASDEEIHQLVTVGADPTSVTMSTDSFGFRWLVIDDPDVGSLVTRVHGAASTLVDHGLGPHLLCAVFGFVAARPPGEGDVRLVYLEKQGTFYPFAPRPGEQRDNELELRVRSFLAGDLPIEPDLTRWMALWDAPVA